MKRIIVCLVLMLMGLSAWAQMDTIAYFIDKKGDECQGIFAVKMRLMIRNGIFWNVNDYYYPENKLQNTGMYQDSLLSVPVGLHVGYYKNAQLDYKGAFVNGQKNGLWKYYYENGVLKDSIYFNKDSLGKFAYSYDELGRMLRGHIEIDGLIEETMYNENGKPKDMGTFKGAIKHGIWKYYDYDGNLCSKVIYDNGKIKNIKNVDKNGLEVEVKSILIKATFPGGESNLHSYLKGYIKWPSAVGFKRQTHDFYTSFIVETDGTISNIQIDGGDHIFYKAIETALIGMPKLNPALEYNRPIRSKCKFPITYTH